MICDSCHFGLLGCSLTGHIFRWEGSEFQVLAAASSYPSLQAAIPTAALFTTTLWLVGKLRLFIEDNGRLHYFIIPATLASVRNSNGGCNTMVCVPMGVIFQSAVTGWGWGRFGG